MTAQSLSALESKLIGAFRVLPEEMRLKVFQTIDQLAEKIEDEIDAEDAERILARIRSGEEETYSLDDVVRSLGLPERKP